MTAVVMVVGFTVKENTKLLPLPPCCCPLGQYKEGLPPGQRQPHAVYDSVTGIAQPPGRQGRGWGHWLSQQEPNEAALASSTRLPLRI